MMRKRLKIVAAISVLCFYVFCGVKMANLNMNDWLLKKYGINKIVYEDEYSKGRYIIIGINNRETLTCCLIEQKVYGKKVVGVSSEIPMQSEGENVYFLCSAYNKHKNWIYWGILWDDSIKNVLINGENSNIISFKMYGWRLCYKIGNESEEPPLHPILIY